MDYKKIITDLGFTANTDEHSRVDSYKEKYSPNNGKVRLELIIADNDGINIDMRINCNGSFAPICVRYEPKTEDELVFLIKGSTRSLSFLEVPPYPKEVG